MDDHSSSRRVAAAFKLPTRAARPKLARRFRPQPLFGIAPGGACRAVAVAGGAVVSCTTVSPLPVARRSLLCGAFPRVAPAGRYPAPLPCGVRTFLTGGPARPSGHPRRWQLDARAATVNPAAKGIDGSQGSGQTAGWRSANSVMAPMSCLSSSPRAQGRNLDRKAERSAPNSPLSEGSVSSG